jgi:hypothetical protein
MIDNPALCVICRAAPLITVLQRDRRACDDCARKTGMIVLPPSRRRASPCTKCNHSKLVRAIPRELTLVPDEIDGIASFGPMFATYEIRTPGGEIEPIHARSGFGVLEAYICTKCGFVEWYCQDPGEIPIGPEYMTEEIDSAGPTPYR